MRALLLLSMILLGCHCATPAHAKNSSGAEVAIQLGDVDGESLYVAAMKVRTRVVMGDDVLYFKINSFGGSIFHGMEFVQFVEEIKKQEGIRVVCAVDSKAMSMGFVFLQSFCDERYMTKRSVLLAHNGSMETGGNADQIQEGVDLLRALNEALAEVCAGRLNISVDEYKAKIAFGAWSMAWEEALAVGAIDGVIAPSDIPPLY